MERIIQAPCGNIKGYYEAGIPKFHAIPYAKPPIGERRFLVPEVAEKWEGVYDATKRGCAPPQYPSNLDKPMGPIGVPTSEDCLTIAVSTPDPEAKLPVAVWFHGGANCYCGGDLPWYDGASLSRSQGIVEVNVNHRLSAMGYLHVKGVIEKTLSIEDDMLALRWINENISAFGGDPERVTLFGQSAGGNAIAHILSRPDSEGLFNQVVLESASLGRGNHTLADAFEVGSAFMKTLGIDENASDVLSQLQSKTVSELLDAADSMPVDIRAKHQGMFFKPVMDAWHTPEQTANTAAENAARRGTRVIIGFTRDEMHAFTENRRPEVLKQMLTDQRLRYEIPGSVFTKRAVELGADIWKYQFNWQAKDSIYHACHCLELPFLFGNIDSWHAPFLEGAETEEMFQLCETVQCLFGAFFRGETFDAAVWPKYDNEARRIKFIDNITNPVDTEPDYDV